MPPFYKHAGKEMNQVTKCSPPKLSGANLLDLGTKGKVKKVFGEAEKQNSIIRHAFCYLRYDFYYDMVHIL